MLPPSDSILTKEELSAGTFMSPTFRYNPLENKEYFLAPLTFILSLKERGIINFESISFVDSSPSPLEGEGWDEGDSNIFTAGFPGSGTSVSLQEPHQFLSRLDHSKIE